MTVPIRPYRPADHHACRALWAELTEMQRDLYDDPGIGGSDPGAEFEDYLTRLSLSGIWVADHPEDGVVGLVGLLLAGRSGEVDPVVVSQRHRSKGIGGALLTHVAAEARQRKLTQLTVVPATRNIAAVRCLHAAGYDTLAAVRLTLDLSGEVPKPKNDMDLLGLRFNY